MNRRNFLKYLLATPIVIELDIEKLLWVKKKTIFIPSLKQIEFINRTAASKLYGIPYHQEVFTGEWLGISRVPAIYKDIEELIKKLQTGR